MGSHIEFYSKTQPAPPAPMRVAPAPQSTGPSYTSVDAPVAPAVGTAAGPLGQNPAYLAFLRALGAEESDLRGVTEDRVSMIQRELDRQLPQLLTQGEEARRGISGNFETRGLYRSGEHEDALGRQRAAEGQGISALQGSAADQIGATENDLLRRLAEIQRRHADTALSTAGGIGYG